MPMPVPRNRPLAALLFCLALPLSAQASGEGVAAADPAMLDAERMPRASRSLLLDVVANGKGLAAVGERGHILFSVDGREWAQAERVPTRSTLTAIAQADGRYWAAGHDGVILHSADDGRTWERQRAAPWQPGNFEADVGVPLLDILFLDGQHGFAVGAYSLLLETRDGGTTWEARTLAAETAEEESAPAPVQSGGDAEAWTFSEDELALEDEADPHLNAIARTGSGALLIAGERGSVFRSRDEGRTWQRLKLPYEGSMFGVLAWQGDHVLVFGLRGNVFESMDLGDTWREVSTGTESSLMGGHALPYGGAVIVGAEGVVLHRARAEEPFRARTFTNAAGETPVLSGVIPADDGLVLIGDRGVDRHRLED